MFRDAGPARNVTAIQSYISFCNRYSFAGGEPECAAAQVNR
jgi:hypothetical protein